LVAASTLPYQWNSSNMTSNDSRATQVLIVGAGLAGFTAALSAAEAGAEVTLVEKGSHHGGSTVLSGGGFAFAGTDAQEAAGIHDTSELLRDDLLKAAKGRGDPGLADLFVERQLDTYQWLRGHGVEFGPVALASSMSVPRAHPVNPHRMMEALRTKISRTNRITYWNDCAAERIVPGRSPEDSLSVAIRRNGSTRDLGVSAGVVIATGGFSQSEMLLERYVPHLRPALRGGGAGNTGDGFLMGLALGADHRDVGYIKGTFGFSLKGGTPPMLLISMYEGGIIVNLHGKRFVDESISYKLIGDACLRQPDGVGLQIFDSRIMDRSSPVPTTNDFRLAEDRGLLVRADTLAQLAELLQIDPRALSETVGRYNSAVREGFDAEFGRRGLGGGFGQLAPIAAAPFYGFPCSTAVIATYCGLAVDRSMQIVNPYGVPVPRVFAAGEVVGGLHGEDYMSGSALSKAAIFGRVAGANAAQLARKGKSSP